MRPGMDQVRDLVAAGGVDVVIAQDADRLSRNPTDMYILKDELQRHGCGLRTISAWRDDSPQGEFFNDVQIAAGKLEKRMIAERNRRGKRQKAQQGKLIAGHTPNYGYRYNEERDGYVVDEDEMDTVRRIFQMIAWRR